MRSWWWKIRERRLRKARADIDRILGGISEHFYIPNQPPPPVLRMKILDNINQWWERQVEATTPRTPEDVALATYEHMRR